MFAVDVIEKQVFLKELKECSSVKTYPIVDCRTTYCRNRIISATLTSSWWDRGAWVKACSVRPMANSRSRYLPRNHAEGSVLQNSFYPLFHIINNRTNLHKEAKPKEPQWAEQAPEETDERPICVYHQFFVRSSSQENSQGQMTLLFMAWSQNAAWPTEHQAEGAFLFRGESEVTVTEAYKHCQKHHCCASGSLVLGGRRKARGTRIHWLLFAPTGTSALQTISHLIQNRDFPGGPR